jgi:hypothetical protein
MPRNAVAVDRKKKLTKSKLRLRSVLADAHEKKVTPYQLG